MKEIYNSSMRLIHGNCFSVLKEMSDDSCDVVFTSPPYNRKRNDKYSIYNDVVSDYKGMLIESINDCMRVCKGHVFFNVQKNYYNKIDVHKVIGHFADNIVEIIIWNKSNPMPSPALQITNSYEYIIVLQRNGKPLKANSTYTKNTLTTPVYSGNPYKGIHRAVMNPDVCDFIFKNFCKEGQLLLDPFLGVGTSGEIALKYGLNFIGVELHREYLDVAKARLGL